MTVLDHDHRADHGGPARENSDERRRSARSRLGRFVSSPWRIVLLAVAAVLAVDAGGTDDGAGVCVFRRCTGGYCPGCGLTRSARHLTRGEFGAAWQDHPFMVILALQAAAGAFVYAVFADLRVRMRSLRSLAVFAVVNGVVLLAIWVVRLVDGSIPRFF